MKRILLSCVSFFVFVSLQAQVNFTANDQVAPYTDFFRPGTNLGFQDDSALYTDEDLANIAAGPLTSDEDSSSLCNSDADADAESHILKVKSKLIT